MATVLVGAYASDPSQIWPEKYKSCYWNFVTGWTCETADPPVVTPPPPVDDGYTPIDNGAVSPNVLPVVSGAAGMTKSGCGCCGGGSASVSPLTGPVSSPVSTAVVAGNPCGCGYTNREALLAVAVAFVFFAIIARKNG
jgi:hypothetical protein